MTLTIEQIRHLAQFAGFILQENTISDDTENETEITISECPKDGIKDDDGSTIHCNHIAYFTEYPEEGVYPLDRQPSPQGTK